MSGASEGKGGVTAVRAELATDHLLADGRRPVAGAVLVNPAGLVLLQHRDDRPDIDSPGQWSLFGGGLDVGETPAAAMLREIEEEIGYRPGPTGRWWWSAAGTRSSTCSWRRWARPSRSWC